MLGLRARYRSVFIDNPQGLAVLADLRQFAGTDPLMVSTVRQEVDVHATMVRVGRQQVINRIVQYLHLSDADLEKLKEHATYED